MSKRTFQPNNRRRAILSARRAKGRTELSA